MTRRIPRSVAFLFTALVVAAASYAAAPLLQPDAFGSARPVPVPGAAGSLPGDAGSELATLGDRLPLPARLSFWAARVEAAPTDFLSLVGLALAHAERARLTADVGAYEQALALVDRSISLVPAYPPTIRARAAIRFATHDFAGAEADARAVLESAPDDPSALAVLGDAALELGRPDDAAAAYARLEVVAPGPWLDVRRARLAYATGDRSGAVQLAARARAIAPDADPENLGFYHYAVGEFGRLAGDARMARIGFEAALSVRPDDPAALVGLARVAASEGSPEEAIAALERATAIAPQPESLALLGDLLAARDEAEAAADLYETVRLTGELGRLAGALYDRQLLGFELDHGGASGAILAQARASLEARPDAAGHDLVAWALRRLGRLDEAAAMSDRARATGIDDARVAFHAGAIALARGDARGGEALLREALARGPALDPVERAEAERLLRG